MRLHRLQLSAFGPYAGTEVVDFDAIAAEGGFFLLRGDTGAGKTSVLDAICFALYGDLPGARSGGKDHLRSDHAADAVEPRVELEFSIRGRRFKVERTPVWFRPKKRGSGTVRANATATLQEDDGGTWVVRGSKPQDVGEALKPLLGMDKEQFTRVAMLPQGDFAKFLHSTSDERGKLLRRLFDTTLFDRAVEIAKLRHDDLRNAAGQHLTRRDATVAELVSGLEARWGEDALASAVTPEALETSLPCGVASHSVADGDRTSETVIPDPVPYEAGAPEWFAAVKDESTVRFERADVDRTQANARAKRARDAVESARSAIRDQTALDEYQQRTSALSERARDEAQQRARLDAHERAGKVMPFLDAERRAGTQVLDAAQAMIGPRDSVKSLRRSAHSDAHAWAAWQTDLDELETLASNVQNQGQDTAAQVRAVASQAQEFTDLAQAEEERAAIALAVEAGAKAARKNAQSAVMSKEQAAQRLDKARDVQGEAERVLELRVDEQVPAPDRDEERAGAEHAEAIKVLEAAKQSADLAASVANAKQQRDAARSEERAAYRAQVELFTARSQAMAAALAQDLRDGAPCAVCGSTEHPDPAGDPATTTTTGSSETGITDLSQAALDAAAALVERTRKAEERAQTALTETEQRHDAAAIAAKGLRVAAASEAAEAADKARRDIAAAWTAHRTAAERLAAAQRDLAASQNIVKVSVEALEAADGAAQQALAAAEESEAKARQALGGHADAQAQLDAARGGRIALARVTQALTDLAGAVERRDEARARAENVLTETGHQRATVREHLLEATQAQALRTELATIEAERAKLQELGNSEPIRRAQAACEAGAAVPDQETVEKLGQATREAEETLAKAEQAVGAARAVGQDITRAHERVQAAERELGPLLEQAATAKSVAELMAGNGENLKSMSLPTYVLAARLETVAEAATQRLAAMGEGRYRLLHQDGKQGNRHSGLGLEVEDLWTGAKRAPETLSGGETFMVSLALALGLADVVQEESGGVDVETLFVDEGFGTLDQQTLDEVLDGLDRLREGGRLVGIVSHVAELAERIPTQIRVTKTREGSTLDVVTATSTTLPGS
ncbi:SMC family ATPase [Galactobacter sp.]|uniref:AAA family ATPase n=1 Tax=Galactobacter sp. TaxID=2676125 RepID=UPI0025B9C80F|nr:SMC family ATPase [Galactobacter sp.]